MLRLTVGQRGLTVIELLAVLAIIVLLAALSFPAIQSARESARRAQCANNLKQLSTAVRTYEFSNKSLPPGSFGGWTGNLNFPSPWADPAYGGGLPWGHFSWSARLLPFVDALPIYNLIDFDVPAYAESVPESTGDRGPSGHANNKAVASRQPGVFACPSAHRVKPTNQFKDYGINHGTGACCPDRTQQDMDGVAFIHSAITADSIKDGLSGTFLFLEFSHFGNHSWVPFDRGANQFIWVHHVSQGYVTCAEHDGTPTPPNSTTFNHRGAHSDHFRGVQASWCDGHVGFISDDIDFTTYRSMFTRAGNDIPRSVP